MKPHIYPHIYTSGVYRPRLVEQASQLPDSEPFIRQVVWRLLRSDSQYASNRASARLQRSR